MVIKKFPDPVLFRPSRRRTSRPTSTSNNISNQIVTKKLTSADLNPSQISNLNSTDRYNLYSNDYQKLLNTAPRNNYKARLSYVRALKQARAKLGLSGDIGYDRKKGAYIRGRSITGVGTGVRTFTYLKTGERTTGGLSTTQNGKRVIVPRSQKGITIEPQKRYVDKFGVVRKEGQTGFNVGDYNLAQTRGVKSKGVVTLKGIRRTVPSEVLDGGQVRGKFYTNITKKEVLNNKLAENSKAVLDKTRTKFLEGNANSRDLTNLLSKGTGSFDLNSLNAVSNIYSLVREQRAGFSKGFTGQVRGKIYRNLTKQEILNNQLEPNSKATELKSKTQQRSSYVQSLRRLEGGRGNSKDLLNVLSRGKGWVSVTGSSQEARRLIANQKEAKAKKERLVDLDVAVKKIEAKVSDIRKQEAETNKITSDIKKNGWNPYGFNPSGKQSRQKRALAGKKARLIFIGQVIRNLDGLVKLPSTVSFLVANPSYISKIPRQLIDAGRNYYTLIQTRPDEALIVAGTEIFLFKGTSAGITKASKLVSKGALKITSGLVKGLKKGGTLVLKPVGQKIIKLKVVSKISKSKLVKNISVLKNKVQSASKVTITTARKIVKVRIPKVVNKYKSQLKTYVNRLFRKRKVKLSPKETKALAKKIDDKLSKLELKELDLKAKAIYQEILKGRPVSTIDDKLLSAIKRYVDKEFRKFTRAERISEIKSGAIKGKMPKAVKTLTKSQRRAFAKDLNKASAEFDRIQAEIVKAYQVPRGAKVFTQEGKLFVVRDRMAGGSLLSQSRLDKLKRAITRKIAKSVEKRLLSGKEVKSIPKSVLAEINRKVSKSKLSLSKTQRKAFAKDLSEPASEFNKIQAEVVRGYKTPSGVRAFTENGKLKVVKYGFEGRAISQSRLDKLRKAITRKIAKSVEKRLLSGKEVRSIPKSVLAEINRKVSKSKLSLSKVQRKSFAKDLKKASAEFDRIQAEVVKGYKVPKGASVFTQDGKLFVVRDKRLGGALLSQSRLDKLKRAITRKIAKRVENRLLSGKEVKNIPKSVLAEINRRTPKSKLSLSKSQKKLFRKDLDKSTKSFDKIQAEIVKGYKTPKGIVAFTENGRLKVSKYGFEGRIISQSRLDKVRRAITRKIAKRVESRLLSGKEVRNIPKSVLAEINRNVRSKGISLSKKQRTALKLEFKEGTKESRLARKKLKRSGAGDKQTRKVVRKQIQAEIRNEESIIKKLVNGDSELGKKYDLEITAQGKVLLKPRKTLKLNRIKTAKEVIRKAKISKGAVNVNKDGTISIIKAKVKSVAKTTSAKPKTASDLKGIGDLLDAKGIGIKKSYLKKVWKQIRAEQRRRKIKAKAPRKVKSPSKIKSKPKIKVRGGKLALGVISAKTFTGALQTAVKLGFKLDQKVSTLSRVKLAQRSESKYVQALSNALVQSQKIENGLEILSKQSISTKQKQKLAQTLSKVRKTITTTKNLIKKKPPIKKKPLNWDTKLPKGQVRVVNPIVRIKGKNVELKWKTTPNRARKRIESAVDNTTSRSFSLKIVGIKKGKDIKPSKSKKFRPKKSRGSAVLPIVEKTKYAIDTRGEKSGLRLSQLLKRKTNAKKIKNTSVRKSRSKKRTSRKKRK